MATAHLATVAFPIGAKAIKEQIRVLNIQRMPYVLGDAEDAGDLVVTDPVTGAVVQDLLQLGRVFHYDPDDSTTAPGATCRVSNDGKRYKLASGTDVVAWAVLDILTAPPATPSPGDAYLVGAAATGAWAGEDDMVAVSTSRGWEFIAFGVGRLLYVVDEDGYYHRKNDGAWEAGLGGLVLSANTVKLSSLIGKPVRFIVENQTTNAPPGSPSIGDAYIIGGAPTGAWAGKAGQVAVWEGAAWGFYAPRDGELAYDKSLKIDVRYDSATPAWASAAGQVIGAGASARAATTIATGGAGNYAYSATTPPSTSSAAWAKDTTSALLVKAKSGKRIRFTYESVAPAATGAAFVGILRDTAAAALDWSASIGITVGRQNPNLFFEVTAPDDDPHTYTVVFFQLSGGGGVNALGPSVSRLSYEVFA